MLADVFAQTKSHELLSFALNQRGLREVKLDGCAWANFQALAEIDLSDNAISCLAPLGVLPSLKRLTLNRNRIRKFFSSRSSSAGLSRTSLEPPSPQSRPSSERSSSLFPRLEELSLGEPS